MGQSATLSKSTVLDRVMYSRWRCRTSATAEDLRRCQLYVVDNGISPVMQNATITALKFFFQITLDRADAMAKMSPVPVPHTLPVVLSREEVTNLIKPDERVGASRRFARYLPFWA
jgi:site-specific recombinase XerD